MTMSRRIAALMAAGLLCGGCAVDTESVPPIDAPPRATQDGGHGTNGTTGAAMRNFKVPVCTAAHYAAPVNYVPGQVVDNSDTFVVDSSIQSILTQHPEEVNTLDHLMYWGIRQGRVVISTVLGQSQTKVGGGGLAIEDATDPSVSLAPKSRNALLTALGATWNNKSTGVPFILMGSLVAPDPSVSVTYNGALHVTAPAADTNFILEMGLEVHCDTTAYGYHGVAYYSDDLLNELLKIPTVKNPTDAVQKIRDRFCKSSGYSNADCPVNILPLKGNCSWDASSGYNPVALFCGTNKVEAMMTMIDPSSVPISY